MTRRCLVVVSDRHEDFRKLVAPEDCSSWSFAGDQAPMIWIVKSETIFNSRILPALSDFDEVCVALHVVDRNPIAVSDRIRVKSFSHTSTDRVWTHAEALVGELRRDVREITSDKAYQVFELVCELVRDRQGQFRDRSVQCLTRISRDVATAGSVSEDEMLENVQSARAACLSNLEALQVSSTDQTTIDRWFSALEVDNEERKANGLSRLSADDWLTKLCDLRDILLGSDDQDGIVHRLASRLSRSQ